jgi:hypothetical protein
MVAVIATAFAAIKLSPAAMELYQHTLGAAQWLPSAVWAVVIGHAPPLVHAVSAVVDPTDLLALPACLVPLWITKRTQESGTSTSSGRSRIRNL